jgi:hypothetical protein
MKRLLLIFAVLVCVHLFVKDPKVFLAPFEAFNGAAEGVADGLINLEDRFESSNDVSYLQNNETSTSTGGVRYSLTGSTSSSDPVEPVVKVISDSKLKNYTLLITEDINSPFQITQEIAELSWKIVQKEDVPLSQIRQLKKDVKKQRKKRLAWLNPKNWGKRRRKRKEARQLQTKKIQIRSTKPMSAQELTDELKAKRLFDWFEENIVYGETKRGSVGYRHAIEVFETKEGVCGEMAILYVVMARSVGLKANYVSVKQDYRGETVAHACAGVWLDTRLVQIDPAYNTYNIHHKDYEPKSDLDATYNFKGWRD